MKLIKFRKLIKLERFSKGDEIRKDQSYDPINNTLGVLRNVICNFSLDLKEKDNFYIFLDEIKNSQRHSGVINSTTYSFSQFMFLPKVIT